MGKHLKYMAAALLVGECFFGIAQARDVSVNGYYRRNGTYVQPYHRTSPNDVLCDNYSWHGAPCGTSYVAPSQPSYAPSQPAYEGGSLGPCQLIPANYPDWRSDPDKLAFMRQNCGM